MLLRWGLFETDVESEVKGDDWAAALLACVVVLILMGVVASEVLRT